jgi:hypothetical protein
MVSENLQTENSAVPAFRVKSFKISADALDKMLEQLGTASWLVNGDFQLDWEDRDTAGRALVDAIYTLRDIRKSGEGVQI